MLVNTLATSTTNSPLASFTNTLSSIGGAVSSIFQTLCQDICILIQPVHNAAETTCSVLCSYLYNQELPSNQQFFLRREIPAYNESTNNQFESLINAGCFEGAFNFLQTNSIVRVHEVKTQALNSLVDSLLEHSLGPLCCQLFKLIISNRPAVLTKFSTKRFVKLALRLDLKQECMELITLLLQTTSTVVESHELLFRIHQYYISGCLKQGDYQTAIDTFTALKLRHSFHDDTNSAFFFKIFEIVIKGCLSKQISKIEESKTYLNEIAVHQPSDVFFNKLIDYAAKNNEIAFAEYIFKVMVSNSIQPSIVTYNTLIDSYFKQNRCNQAWILFELLKKSDKKPDNFTYTTMINGLKSMDSPDLTKAFTLFSEYKQVNRPDQIIYNCLLDACINSSDLSRAHELFIEMKQDSSIRLDEITYNTLIKGCCKARRLSQAIQYYEDMKSQSIRPNRITHNSLIDTCVKSGKMKEAWRFYEEMTTLGVIPDNFTYSILINGIKSNHSSRDELARAIDLLNGIQSSPNFKPDEILYNSLIDACIKFNEINRGLSLYEEMKKKKIEPSPVTYGILIKAFGKMNDLVKAFQIFEQMKLKQMRINDVTYGCLLDACVKNDRMDLALILIDKMKQDNITLNTILYTTLIKGFSRAGKLDEALRIFNIMKESPKAQPNQITYNCTIDACVKADNLLKAGELFEELSTNSRGIKPDLITYSTMIKGFCRQKNILKAYYYLSHMQKQGVAPDEGLFNQVLECCHACNNCELGVEIFNTMINSTVKVCPSNVTFSILIKLYSKARKIHLAVGVIAQMRAQRIRPSMITYTNLIQACFNAKKAEKVSEVLTEMEKDDLRCDSIFYAKVIAGFLSYGMIELAWKYCEKSMREGVVLGLESYSQVSRALSESDCQEKAIRLSRMEDYTKKCNNKKPIGGATPREERFSVNDENRNRSNQMVQQPTAAASSEDIYPKKRFFNSNQTSRNCSTTNNQGYYNNYRGNKENHNNGSLENRNMSQTTNGGSFFDSKKKNTTEETCGNDRTNIGYEKPQIATEKNNSFFGAAQKSVLKENKEEYAAKSSMSQQNNTKKVLNVNNKEFVGSSKEGSMSTCMGRKSIYSSKML